MAGARKRPRSQPGENSRAAAVALAASEPALAGGEGARSALRRAGEATTAVGAERPLAALRRGALESDAPDVAPGSRPNSRVARTDGESAVLEADVLEAGRAAGGLAAAWGGWPSRAACAAWLGW